MKWFEKIDFPKKIYLLMAPGLLILLVLTACGSVQGNTTASLNRPAKIAKAASIPEDQATAQDPALKADRKMQTVPALAEPTDVVIAQDQPTQGLPVQAQAVQATQAAPIPTPEAAPTTAPVESVPPAASQNDPPLETRPEVGFKAPDFSLTSLDGRVVSLSQLRGQPVVLNYWATWCEPCKKELPILEQLSQEFAASGIQIVTINAIEQDSLDNVQGLIGELGLTMPVLLDQQNQFQASYNQLFFPTSYFIDANGIIRMIKLGDASEAQLRENLEKLVNHQL